MSHSSEARQLSGDQAIPRLSAVSAKVEGDQDYGSAGAGVPAVRQRIAVVNDQPCQLRFTSQVLKLAGYTVLSYTSALLALDGLERDGLVDLIVTDLNMPKMSGWSFCEALRSPRYKAHNQTPILAVSATFAGLESESVCLELGVNGFLPMPFTVENLRRKVADILEGRCPRSRLRALLLGFAQDSPEAVNFREFGYQVTTCFSLVDALAVKEQEPPHVFIVKGDYDANQAIHLFEFRSPVVALLWVAPQVSAELSYRLSKMGVQLITMGYRPEYLVGICEKGRQQGSLTKTRDLLEERTLQLISSEAKYRTLFQSIPDPVLLADETGEIINVNEAGCLILGQSAEQIIGRPLRDLALEEYSSQVQDMLHQTVLYGYVQYETAFKVPGGEIIAEVHQRKLILGGKANILAIARDISERRQFQEAVRLSDMRYRILAENTYDWEFWISPTGHFLFSSPACEKLTGYSPRDFEDDSYLIHQLVHPDDVQLFTDMWPVEEHFDSPRDFTFRIYRADGELRWINHVSQIIYDNYGNFLGSRGSHRDITEKHQGEQERARLVSAVEQVAEAILITDVEGNIQFANQAYLESNGLGAEDVLGRTPHSCENAENGDALGRDITSHLQQGKNWSGCYVKRNPKTRQNMHVEATVSVVRDKQGHSTHCIWVERDVTQERMLQDQLRQSQKMEAVGTLAGGIAHDFNNLLSGILGYAGLLKMQAPDNVDVLHAADVIERTARRAADLTQKLLGFARQGKHQNVALSIHQSIGDCIELLNRTLDKRIQIVTDFCSADPRIMGDPTQLEQILLNLAINARDAMGEKGILTFRTSCLQSIPRSDELPATESIRGPVVVLEVNDTGTGIPPELQSRIFDPFFTTKENGKGTGMGLAMVYGIVRNHGGSIEVKSKMGEGTSFVIYMPLAESVKPKEPDPRPAAPTKGTGKILIVDDEDLLRDVARRLLKHLGYQVAAAADGIEACEYYAKNQNDIDLVIIDMIMPNMAGPECYRTLKKLNPNIRAILSTGYSLNETAQELLDEGMVGFVQKPYQLSHLSEAVARALSPATEVQGA